MTKLEPRIVIIGAGPGGVTCAIALKEKYGFTDFVIYEQASDVGGTWRSNIYPGCSSDITMPFYSLSTELRNWTASHLPQPDLLAYWVELAKKHNLYPHIIFNRRVASAAWNHSTQLYNLVLSDADTGESSISEAHIVISAVGIFGLPRYADIPGLESFKGDLFHSARWDYSKELRGRRVGVIGNGASSTQFVPVIVEDPTTHVVQFCRTQNWLLFSLRKRYSVFRRTLFYCFPFMMRISRWAHFVLFETLYAIIFANAITRWVLMKLATKFMKLTAPQRYHDVMIPKYELGCKRIVFDSNYMKALHAPNLELNYDGIDKIVDDGILTKKGEHIPLDVIIFATGYAADTYPIPIQGNHNKTIQQYFEEHDGPRAYIGTAVPGFPNFFMIFGPNIATGHTSVVWSNELQVNYIMQLIEPIMERAATAIEVRDDATDAYNTTLQARLSKSVYSSCNSWYRVGGTGKLSSVFPGASSELYFKLRRPNWKHFSGAGIEPWLQKRRRVARIRFLGKMVVITALVAGAYNANIYQHSLPTIDVIREWVVDTGASYISYATALIQSSG